jgi:hypothetical protein
VAGHAKSFLGHDFSPCFIGGNGVIEIKKRGDFLHAFCVIADM